MPAKDGKWRQKLRESASRPRSIRALVASMAFVAAIGALLVTRRALSSFSPRRKLQVPADVPGTDLRLQQFTRYRAADGTQSIHGTLLADFVPGERSTTLYVAFCPPFERLPSVEAEAIDDASASVKLTQLLHNGVQIEIRLSQPANEKQTVTIEMVATDSANAET